MGLSSMQDMTRVSTYITPRIRSSDRTPSCYLLTAFVCSAGCLHVDTPVSLRLCNACNRTSHPWVLTHENVRTTQWMNIQISSGTRHSSSTSWNQGYRVHGNTKHHIDRPEVLTFFRAPGDGERRRRQLDNSLRHLQQASASCHLRARIDSRSEAPFLFCLLAAPYGHVAFTKR
jgi:hypothetical protein